MNLRVYLRNTSVYAGKTADNHVINSKTLRKYIKITGITTFFTQIDPNSRQTLKTTQIQKHDQGLLWLRRLFFAVFCLVIVGFEVTSSLQNLEP